MANKVNLSLTLKQAEFLKELCYSPCVHLSNLDIAYGIAATISRGIHTKVPYVWWVEVKRHDKDRYNVAYGGVYATREWARERARRVRLLWPKSLVRVVKYIGEVQ